MSISTAGHRISLEEAVAMTSLYRKNQPNGMPICETFDSGPVELMVANPNAAFFRIYYGMKTDGSIHAILVAADKDGKDLLPLATGQGVGDDGEGDILEDVERCPTACPPPSPLNG